MVQICRREGSAYSGGPGDEELGSLVIILRILIWETVKST